MEAIPPNIVTYKNILCPVDFSDCSTKAFYRAVGYCQLFGAKLTVLSVREGGPVTFYDDISSGRETLELLREGLVTRLDLLQEEGQVTREERDRIALETRNGKPFEEILRFALEGNVDLIVMGTHGHTAMGNLVMGSVATKVLAASKVPVLLLK